MTRKLPVRRSNCPIAVALDFIGDKWTLVVLRDLIMARKRYFQELLAGDEGIATNILTSRLKRLEAGGLVTSGVGVDGEVRIVELPNHPFFLVTLFVPQARSTAASPHPLMVGFAASAAEHRRGPQS